MNFKNYFGPYLAIKLSNGSTNLFEFVIRVFDLRYGNGYNPGKSGITFYINLVALAFIILLDVCERNKASLVTEFQK